MKRIRTDEELKKAKFLTQTEIGRLLGMSYTEAHRVFQMAQRIDMREFPESMRIYGKVPRKVSKKSVCRLIGESPDKLHK